MNNYPGLTWEFNQPSDKVDFMDLTISIQMAKFQHHYSKNRLISTYIYPLTLPSRLDSSQASSTVPSSEFLLNIPTQMIKSYEQRFF